MNPSNRSLSLNDRLNVYHFLVTAFYEPSSDLVNLLRDHDRWAELVQTVEKLCGQESSVIRELPAALTTLQDLRVEYTRLFLGPAAPPCPPYESVYDPNRPFEQQGTILGPATTAMERALRAEGLAIVLDYAEYADHIAIELELMYHLLSKGVLQSTEPESTVQAANTFLSERLLPWLPAFGDKLASETKHPFYIGLGNLLSSIIRNEGTYYSV